MKKENIIIMQKNYIYVQKKFNTMSLFLLDDDGFLDKRNNRSGIDNFINNLRNSYFILKNIIDNFEDIENKKFYLLEAQYLVIGNIRSSGLFFLHDNYDLEDFFQKN